MRTTYVPAHVAASSDRARRHARDRTARPRGARHDATPLGSTASSSGHTRPPTGAASTAGPALRGGALGKRPAPPSHPGTVRPRLSLTDGPGEQGGVAEVPAAGGASHSRRPCRRSRSRAPERTGWSRRRPGRRSCRPAAPAARRPPSRRAIAGRSLVARGDVVGRATDRVGREGSAVRPGQRARAPLVVAASRGRTECDLRAENVDEAWRVGIAQHDVGLRPRALGDRAERQGEAGCVRPGSEHGARPVPAVHRDTNRSHLSVRRTRERAG
jgi:hypothetical protein